MQRNPSLTLCAESNLSKLKLEVISRRLQKECLYIKKNAVDPEKHRMTELHYIIDLEEKGCLFFSPIKRNN